MSRAGRAAERAERQAMSHPTGPHGYARKKEREHEERARALREAKKRKRK